MGVGKNVEEYGERSTKRGKKHSLLGGKEHQEGTTEHIERGSKFDWEKSFSPGIIEVWGGPLMGD